MATPSTDQIQIRSKQSFTRPPNKSFRDKSFLNINFSSELFSSTSSELGWVNCSFQFVDFVNFIGNFQSVITQPNLAQKSGSFELLAACTTRFSYWKLNLVKIRVSYEGFS